jgi:excisionase family DNA binding protein
MSRHLIDANAKHQRQAALEPIVADLIERVQRLEAARPPPKLLPISAAADFLGLSPATIYRLLGLGELTGLKAGSKTLLTMESLQRYADALPLAKIKAPPNNQIATAQAAKPMRRRKQLSTKPRRKRAEAGASNNEASA